MPPGRPARGAPQARRAAAQPPPGPGEARGKVKPPGQQAASARSAGAQALFRSAPRRGAAPGARSAIRRWRGGLDRGLGCQQALSLDGKGRKGPPARGMASDVSDESEEAPAPPPRKSRRTAPASETASEQAEEPVEPVVGPRRGARGRQPTREWDDGEEAAAGLRAPRGKTARTQPRLSRLRPRSPGPHAWRLNGVGSTGQRPRSLTTARRAGSPVAQGTDRGALHPHRPARRKQQPTRSAASAAGRRRRQPKAAALGTRRWRAPHQIQRWRRAGRRGPPRGATPAPPAAKSCCRRHPAMKRTWRGARASGSRSLVAKRRARLPTAAALHAAATTSAARRLACRRAPPHCVQPPRWMTRPRPAVLRPPAAALHHMDNAGGRSRKAGECAWLPAPAAPGDQAGQGGQGSGGGSGRAARGGRAYPTGAAFWPGSTAAACSMVGGRGRVRGGGAVPRAVLL